MSRRRLRPDEEELWRKVADRTKKLHPQKPFKPEDFVSPAPPKQATRSLNAVVKTPAGPQKAQGQQYTLSPGIAESVAGIPVQMHRKTFDQLKRGKIRPEAKLDLHGMTLDRAFPALT